MSTTPANHAEALAVLRRLQVGVQKARSDLLESMGDDALAQRLLEEQHPWLFGPRCPLPAITALISRAEQGAPIEGAVLRNFLWIAEREPALDLVAFMLDGEALPEPEPAMAALIWKR